MKPILVAFLKIKHLFNLEGIPPDFPPTTEANEEDKPPNGRLHFDDFFLRIGLLYAILHRKIALHMACVRRSPTCAWVALYFISKLLILFAGDSGLSTGDVVGIVFGVFIGVALIGGAAFGVWYFFLPRGKTTSTSNGSAGFTNRTYADLEEDFDDMAKRSAVEIDVWCKNPTTVHYPFDT